MATLLPFPSLQQNSKQINKYIWSNKKKFDSLLFFFLIFLSITTCQVDRSRPINGEGDEIRI